MSKYAFTFKKDDIFVEFFTTDKEVVEKQFQLWVASADEYANNRPKKAAKKESNAQPQVIEEKKETQSAAIPPVEEEPIKASETVEEEPEVFDKASTLLKTINTIQEEKGKAEELIIEQPAEIRETPSPSEVQNFEDVLEKTIENPTFEPNKTQDKVFLNLVNSKNTMDKFHYLIITAYYLSEFEKLERFSLKQINAKLMQNLSEVIDHTTLQEAINQNFIELVPDLTGTSEVGEYRLTPAGEDFFANKI